MLADVTAMRTVLGAAVRGYRTLGRPEASWLFLLALAFLALAGLLAWLPRLLVYPLVGVLAWEAIALGVKAWRLRFARPRDRDRPPAAPS